MSKKELTLGIILAATSIYSSQQEQFFDELSNRSSVKSIGSSLNKKQSSKRRNKNKQSKLSRKKNRK